MPEFLWKTQDYEGVEMVLESSVWYDKILHPILGHPEVKDYLNEIKLTVQSPEAVFQSVRDSRSKLFYRSGLLRGRFSMYWIVVVVKYVQEAGISKGYISTAFITRSLKRGGIKIWPKSIS